MTGDDRPTRDQFAPCGRKLITRSGLGGRTRRWGAACATPHRAEVTGWLSGEVEAVVLHDLHPTGDEVAHEVLLATGGGDLLGEGPQLAVGAEDQVDARRLPLGLVRRAVAALVDVLALTDGLPLGAHVEEVDEEVVGELALAVGELAVALVADVAAEHPQAADERRHLRRRQVE